MPEQREGGGRHLLEQAQDEIQGHLPDPELGIVEVSQSGFRDAWLEQIGGAALIPGQEEEPEPWVGEERRERNPRFMRSQASNRFTNSAPHVPVGPWSSQHRWVGLQRIGARRLPRRAESGRAERRRGVR